MKKVLFTTNIGVNVYMVTKVVYGYSQLINSLMENKRIVNTKIKKRVKIISLDTNIRGNLYRAAKAHSHHRSMNTAKSLTH